MFLIQRLTLQQMSQKKIKLTEINFENAWIYICTCRLQHISKYYFINVKNAYLKQISPVLWKTDFQIYSYMLLKTLSMCLCLVSS